MWTQISHEREGNAGRSMGVLGVDRLHSTHPQHTPHNIMLR